MTKKEGETYFPLLRPGSPARARNIRAKITRARHSRRSCIRRNQRRPFTRCHELYSLLRTSRLRPFAPPPAEPPRLSSSHPPSQVRKYAHTPSVTTGPRRWPVKNKLAPYARRGNATGTSASCRVQLEKGQRRVARVESSSGPHREVGIPGSTPKLEARPPALPPRPHLLPFLCCWQLRANP